MPIVTTLLLIYIGLYTLVVGGTLLVFVFLLPAEEKKDTPWRVTAVDTVLFVAGLAGMLFLATGYDAPAVKTLWKFVAPAMVVIQLAMNIHARAKHMRTTGDVPDAQTRIGDFGMLLFVAPALALNLAYAFAAR